MSDTMLSVPLQSIAQRYIAARRRSGEALLEAARVLTEARSIAQHGEWYTFLNATQTTPATAERLLNIHQLASENLQFAGFIADNWIGQSAAALLARPSTPQAARDVILSSDTPPTVADVQQAIKSAIAEHDIQKAREQLDEYERRLAVAFEHIGAAGRVMADVHARMTSTQFNQWLMAEFDGMTFDTARALMDYAEDARPPMDMLKQMPEALWSHLFSIQEAANAN